MTLHSTQGLPRLLISREALLHNLRFIRKQLPMGVKVCAMVKANAYGHDADLVVDTLCNFEYPDLPSPAVDQLAVATFEEAEALPQMLPILVLRPVENLGFAAVREGLERAISFGWILSLQSAAAIDDVARIAVGLGRRAKVHMMIDTGMSREGCAIEELPGLLTRMAAYGSIKLVSVGTHFASADEPGSAFVAQQFDRFNLTLEALDRPLDPGVLRHVANSGATFLSPATHLEMVRPGLSLYGIDPTGTPNRNRALRPVAKWTAPLIGIHTVRKGQPVGYGQTWIAERDTRIGLLPVGYADGYARNLGNRAVTLMGKIPAPVVGRVSMDLITIDLEQAPAAAIGDEVTLLDNDPLSPASAYALAKLGETIPYEVFTRIGSRIRRVAAEQSDELTILS